MDVLSAAVAGRLSLATALPETSAAAACYFEPADPGDLARRLADLLADPAALATHRGGVANNS